MESILIILGVLFVGGLATYLLHKGSRKWIVLISRIFVGVVFLYSGFVKAVDPLGSTYKFLDYFQYFGLTFLNDFAFPLSILQSSLEFLVGLGLLLGTFLRFYTWLGTLFMLLFTPVTLVLALTNAVSDCGCFGDAWVLTNWETFWKNTVIDIPIIILLLRGKRLINPVKLQKAFFINALGAALIVYVSIYSYNHLPILDFRPYKIGNNIQEGMSIPEGAKMDVYKSTFTYKNLQTGEERVFSEAELSEPADHSELWEYVDSYSELIEKGYHPPIHDFTISNSEEGDITEQILSEPMTLLCIAYDLEKTDFESFVKLDSLALVLKQEGIKLRVVTSALNDQIAGFKDSLINKLDVAASDVQEASVVYFYQKDGQVHEFKEKDLPENLDEYEYIGSEDVMEQATPQLSYDFYICDPITLKTIVRANPGFVLLKEGTIVAKWHYNDWIDFDGFKARFLNKK